MIESKHFNYIHEYGGNTPETLRSDEETINSNIEKFRHIEDKWKNLNKNQKTYFFISNTQIDFEKFLKPGEHFKAAFGLTRNHILILKNTIEKSGFSDFKIITLNRFIEDSISIEINPIENVCDYFYGNLRAGYYKSDSHFNQTSYTNQTVIAELCYANTNDFQQPPLPHEIYGDYIGSDKTECQIKPVSQNTSHAIILKNSHAVGILRQSYNGIVCAMSFGKDAVSFIQHSNNSIIFPRGYCLSKKNISRFTS